MPKIQCRRKGCLRVPSQFNQLLGRRAVPAFEGRWFCSLSCLKEQVDDELREKWNGLQRDRTRQVPRPKIGTILMDSASVTAEQLGAAISLQRQTRHGRLGEWLLRLGYVEERQITMALSRQLGIPMIHLNETGGGHEAARMIPGQVARGSGVVPVGYDDDRASLRIAVSDPSGLSSQDAIRRMIGRGVVTFIGDESAIRALLERTYPPEELDLSNLPTYASLADLREIGGSIVCAAADGKATGLQMELLDSFFWARTDFPRSSRHRFFRLAQPAAPFHGATACAPQLALGPIAAAGFPGMQKLP